MTSNGGALVTSAVHPSVAQSVEVYAQLQAVRNVLAPDLNDIELQLFAMVAQRSRLDPFAKQIYAIKRGGRLTFQTGIDGFRGSAEDTGEYDGQDEPEYGEWTDRPFPHPASARVTVHRFKDGRRISQSATARWESYYPGEQIGAQWKRMPDVMLAKCAEALAFRKLFPKRFADVYAPEEMAQADIPVEPVNVAPTARERVAERRAAITSGAPVRAGQGSGPDGGGGRPVSPSSERADEPPHPADSSGSAAGPRRPVRAVSAPEGETPSALTPHAAGQPAVNQGGDAGPSSNDGVAIRPDPVDPARPLCGALPPEDHPLRMTAPCEIAAGSEHKAHRSKEGSWPA